MNKIRNLAQEFSKNSRWKIQTADGKNSIFRLLSKLYKSRLQVQTEIQMEKFSKNVFHLEIGMCLSAGTRAKFPQTEKFLKKILKIPDGKILLSHIACGFSDIFQTEILLPITIVIENHKGSLLTSNRNLADGFARILLTKNHT